jgi:hypothetical protein
MSPHCTLADYRTLGSVQGVEQEADKGAVAQEVVVGVEEEEEEAGEGAPTAVRLSQQAFAIAAISGRSIQRRVEESTDL